MEALREGMLSEGTRITPRTPKRLAIPRLHWLRRMGVTELGPNLRYPAKRKGQNMHASVKTFVTLTLCLTGR